MDNKFRTKKLAYSGILLALVIITLFFATFLPTSRLALYVLSSFFISIIIVEFGVYAGWSFYLASNILAFFVISNKIGLIPYTILFGIYGIVKFYIEKLNKLPFEYILKLVYFNFCLILAFIFIKEFLMYNIKIQLPWWTLLIVLEILFIIYDYIYTRFINYYLHKLKRIIGGL